MDASMSALAKLMAEASYVASRDADAITQQYAWPPREPMTDEEIAEVGYLDSLGRRLSRDSAALGFEDGGTDQLYGSWK